jgi:hypothetical protein
MAYFEINEGRKRIMRRKKRRQRIENDKKGIREKEGWR